MYFDTSLKTSRRDYSDLSSPGLSSRNRIFFSFWKETFFLFEGVVQESDGSEDNSVTRKSDGSADNSVTRNLPFVTVLAPVRAVGDKGRGWQVSLSCSRW
jgi:hypothetical protein